MSGRTVPSRGRLMTVLVLEAVAAAFSVWAAVSGVYDNTFSTALMWAVAGVLTLDFARNAARLAAADRGSRP
ncbi:hypothetical protein [Actinoplanes sp. NPDC051411]|uniref:hypothetical protein n=1 Tax=Actinoplanes sp. NPDC051411 TaxID=3155522 RepID=UPI00342AB070